VVRKKGLKMRLIKLTDFYTKTQPEYLDADDVARIETFESEYVDKEEYEETTGIGFFKKTFTKTRYVNQHKRTGSEIFMKCGESTCVLESPEQVAALVKGE
jgi:hypothetical protein